MHFLGSLWFYNKVKIILLGIIYKDHEGDPQKKKYALPATWMSGFAMLYICMVQYAL